MNPLAWIDDELAGLETRGLRRKLLSRQGPQRGDKITIDGRELVNFGSNDYLGLAADPRIAEAAKRAIDEYGWGSGASPLVTGRSELHAELERKLAEFEGTEAALLFPSGYAANVGTITALVGKGDAIYSDELNHASIIDGCRLSGAAVHVYAHDDIYDLERQISNSSAYCRKLVVTDSLFSMHGDFAQLAAMAELTIQFGAMFMVDEAHATGVFGAWGCGRCDEEGVEPHVHVRIGTLSKAIGSHGGFAAGSRRLIDWLANRARPYFFSTAAPSAVAGAALAALSIIQRDPWPGEKLVKLAEATRNRLRLSGLNTGNSLSQIVPVILGDANRTMAAAAALRERGFFVPGIRPPSVPEGQSLLRISLTCLHTEEQIDALVAAISEVVR